MSSQTPDSIPKPADAVRVLHTADWHLGKMLGDLDRSDEHQRFLDWLLGELVRQQVDVLLIAGDIFDTANPPQAAERQYFEFLAGVYRETKCSVVVTGGNHDSPTHLEAPRRVLQTLGVHVIGALPVNIEDLLVPLPSAENPQLVIVAVPFLRDRDLRTGAFGQTADEIRDELRRGIEGVYRRAADACASFRHQGAALIAMGHLTVAGARVSESERVVHVGGLGKVDHKVFPEDFSYVALGHLHRPQAMGADTIRYSGSPIPLSFSECEDVKEVRLLDVHQGELIANHTLPIPVTRHLAQVRAMRVELEQVLMDLAPARGALPSWIEVTVETADASENLFEVVQKLTEHRRREFEIVRVQARRERTKAALCGSEDEQSRSVDALLDDPLQVFERRLELVADLPEREANEMRVAFRELYQIHLDSDEGREAKALTPETVTNTKTKVGVPKAVAAEAKVEELQFDLFDGGTPE
ncbi:MAG: exonuclease SbcCD subunit D C-terminal domain-containing protein [Verrucomicrobia bacterium]|nr:exonuclease SbcCD subunit D C-terminal domain-containing protein [Verrucomicrobiota bacterium]